MAKKNSVPILMANCVGYCDNFLSVGATAVWSKKGALIEKLDDKSEGILVFDTETEQVVCHQR
jgi:predicted amidohydrolase